MFRNPIVDVAVVLIIVLLVMGPKKLPQLGRGLGQGMREFKDGITGDSKDSDEGEKLSLKPVDSPPAQERPTQTTAAQGRDAGSEPRA